MTDVVAWPVAIGTAVGALAPTIAAVGAWVNSRKAHKAVNNRPAAGPTISDDVAAIRVVAENQAADLRHLRERFDQHMIEHDRRGWRGR